MSDSSSHDLLVAKCVAMACMFCATALFGTIPFLLNYRYKWTGTGSNARSAKVVTWLLYFGGGVLLATTFVHLLPEVQEVVEHLQECDEIKTVDFAVAETLMCAGFFLMYLIEEVIHMFLHKNKKKPEAGKKEDVAEAFERGHSMRNSVLVKGARKTNDNAEVSSSSSRAAIVPSEFSYENMNYEADRTAQGSSIDSEIQIAPVEHNTAHHAPNNSHEHSHSHDHAGHGHSHLPLPTNDDDDNVIRSSLRGLGIVLALSLHEIFEGLAIGLEGDTASVWFLFAAVSAHKLVLAFCVSVELIVARTRPALAVVYTITFAIVSPIGIAIGIAVSHNSGHAEASIPSMILQGLACGTLLYVVFFEILSKHHAGFGAYIAMLLGFGLMFGLQNIGEPASSDENECAGSVAPSTAATLMDMTTTALMNMTTTTMPTTTGV